MLGPAYDLTYGYRPGSQCLSQQFLSVNGKFQDITRQDLIKESERFSVKNPCAIISEVPAALDNFSSFAMAAGLSVAQIDKIAREFVHP